MDSSASAHHDDYDDDSHSEHSSSGQSSRLNNCFHFSQRTRDLFSDWRSLFWKKRPVRVLLWTNTLAFLAVICSEILMFETSNHEVRRQRHRTAIFPLYIPYAVGLAFACKWEGSVAWANFVGFVVGRVYIAGRDGYNIVEVKFFYFVILSFVGMLEVQLAAHLVRIKLCHSLKSVPSIDTVRDALWYFATVFVVSLVFETLAAVVNCTTGLLAWSQFPRFWSTWWLAVFAALLTISPAFIHGLDYRPRYASIFRPSKILECIVLVACTVCVLGLITFSIAFTTVIRPLPYLLYPVLVFSVFRFNRLGWAVVVVCISYFCSWGTLHYQSSALYIISGVQQRSSPQLILQIELFMSVLGVVAITLAAAVREKKQLTKDLHNMNQKLEEAVRKRTQELMKANSELQVSQATAEKANHAKSDFLANMSHEIRTPIHGILGLTDLLCQSELSSDQLESLGSVKDCADLLLHIINSILDLAKIEAGRLEVECVPFKIRDVVSTTLRMLQERAKERGIQLLWKVDANVPPLVAGDPGKLQQCLLNLVGNALKFTHQGSVIVSVRVLATSSEPAVPLTTPLGSQNSEELPKKLSRFSRLRSWASWPSSDVNEDTDEETGNVIELQHTTFLGEAYPVSMETSDTAMIIARDPVSSNSRLLETGERILFEVRDTGIGISNEIVQEMFNPFTQADASTSRLYGGTGLGLCIVQRFVELLNGKIWVESEIGKGSNFCFVVPFQLLLSDEAVSASRRLHQSYHEILEPVKTSSVTLPRIHERAAAQHSPEVSGRRVHSRRSLDSSSSSGNVMDEQGDPIHKQSADLVDTKKRPLEDREEFGLHRLEDREELGPNTVNNECCALERQPKLQKGKAGLTFTDEFASGYMSEGCPLGAHSDIPSTSECISSLDFTTSVEAVELPDSSGKEGNVNVHCDKKLSNPSSNLVDTSNVDLPGWDVEQGLDGTTDPNPEFVELGIDSTGSSENRSSNPVMTPKVISWPKVDTVSRGQSMQISRLLPRKANLHILLAEDNPINQKVASRQLLRHGHTVTIVGDGFQALETLRRDHDKFDLVLMDIQMPNLDGLRATSIFREEEAIQRWRRLPVLGLTAHAISGYQDTCLSHGMDAYLSKPFQIQELLQVIEGLCFRS